MVGPEIHDFSLDDQLTVDFIHPMSWLLKYFEVAGFGSYQTPLVRTAKQNKTAIQYSSQFSAFNFND